MPCFIEAWHFCFESNLEFEFVPLGLFQRDECIVKSVIGDVIVNKWYSAYPLGSDDAILVVSLYYDIVGVQIFEHVIFWIDKDLPFGIGETKHFVLLE